jgi:hypothetical protein
MTFSFEYTSTDFAHYPRKMQPLVIRWYGNLLWIATCISGVIFIYFNWDELGYVFLFLFILLPFVQWMAPGHLARVIVSSPSMRGTRTIEVDERSLRFTHPTFQLELFWSYFIAYRETHDVFLLLQSEAAAQVLPKRAMTEGDISDLRNLLQQKLPKEQR